MIKQKRTAKARKIISWLINRNKETKEYEKFTFMERHDPLEDLNLCYNC